MNTKQMLMLGIPELPEAAFGGDLPPMQRKVLVQAMGIRPQKGGGFTALIGVVAAIAIPFAATAIVGAMASSTAIAASMPFITAALSTTAGATIGSAIVGAGLGAISSKVTGGNVGRGALMGGISGGIGGYLGSEGIRYAAEGTAFNNTLTSAQGVPANAGAGYYGGEGTVTNAGVVPYNPPGAVGVNSLANAGTGYYGGEGTFTNAGVVPYSPPGGVEVSSIADTLGSGVVPYTQPGGVPANAGAGYYGGEGTVTNAGVVPYNPPGAVGVNPLANAGTGYYGGEGTVTNAGVVPYSPPGGVTVTDLPSATSAGATGSLDKFGAALKSKFTNPQAQADLFLRAAGQLAGNALAGNGLSREEKALLNQQTTELQELRTTNKALFDQRLQEAQSLMGESKYFDPSFFGMQAQRGVQTAGARAKREALTQFGPRRAGLRSAEERRFDLGISTGGQTAYLQGADAAQQNRIRTQQAGLSALPTGGPSGALQYGQYVGSLYDATDKRRRAAAGDFGNLVGSFTGDQKANSLGL